MDFEILYNELRYSAETIRSLVEGITPEESRLKPDLKSWSQLEVICHLHDEECEDFREHLDLILHRPQEEWHRIDPQGWVTKRKYNEQNFEEMKNKFFDEREKSLNWLGGLSNADWNTTYVSPFGAMSAGDMFASWVAHDNLHIRQLTELRRHRIENITKPYQIEYAGEW